MIDNNVSERRASLKRIAEAIDRLAEAIEELNKTQVRTAVSVESLARIAHMVTKENNNGNTAVD